MNIDWLIKLITEESIPQTVIIFGLVIAVGVWLGRLKIFGISLGVTWVLFMGLAISYAGIHVNKETEHFLREFGLILFVYTIGLQVGPGFFASLKKNAWRIDCYSLLLFFRYTHAYLNRYHEWCCY